jgi:hypothetical protein
VGTLDGHDLLDEQFQVFLTSAADEDLRTNLKHFVGIGDISTLQLQSLTSF